MPNNFPQTVTPLDILNNYFFSFYSSVFNSIITIFGAVVIFLLGWIIAWAIKEVVLFILSKLRLKDWLHKVGLGKYIEDFSWEDRLDQVLAEITFWTILVVFFMTSLDILGLQIISSFIRQVVNYLPRAISGGLILALGFIFGELVRKVLHGVLRGLDKRSANGVAIFVKWTIVVFAFLAAFNQWGIAPEVMNILAQGIVIFVAIAGGLAFGLGGQDVAREFLENIRNKFR